MLQPNLKLARFSWALYDLANTVFSMNIISLYFVLWLTVDQGCAEIYYSLTLGGSIFLAALLMPILGELSDRLKRRVPFLIGFTLGCVIFTALLGFVKGIFLALLFLCLANFCYQSTANNNTCIGVIGVDGPNTSPSGTPTLTEIETWVADLENYTYCGCYDGTTDATEDGVPENYCFVATSDGHMPASFSGGDVEDAKGNKVDIGAYISVVAGAVRAVNEGFDATVEGLFGSGALELTRSAARSPYNPINTVTKTVSDGYDLFNDASQFLFGWMF